MKRESLCLSGMVRCWLKPEVDMPLKKGKSKKAFEYNIGELIRSGKPKRQALAIAYDVKRRSK